MATITLPTDGQTGWGAVLRTAINAINTQLETLVPSGNLVIRGNNSTGSLVNISYASTVTNSALVQRESTGQVNVSATPVNASHAASKSYVDAQIATVSGGGAAITAASITDSTAVGRSLITATDAAAARTAAGVTIASGNARVAATDSGGAPIQLDYATTNTAWTLARRDAAGAITVATAPTATGHATSKSYVDGLIATKAEIPSTANRIVGSGSTAGVQASYTFSQSATPDTLVQRSSSGQVAVATPTVDGNAASKGYVDSKIPWKGTQAEYDAIATKDPARLYVITA